MKIFIIKYWYVKGDKTLTSEREVSAYTRKTAKLQFKKHMRGEEFGVISIEEDLGDDTATTKS